MENDVNENPDVQQDGGSSAAGIKGTGNEEERTIPYDRFKEVNDSYKAVKAETEELKEEIAKLKTSKPEEEEKEPETWKEVEERAAKRALNEFKRIQETERAKQEEIDKSIEQGFKQLKSLGQEITPAVEKTVLERMVKTGESVHDAYISIKSELSKESKSKQIKDEGYIPESKGTEAKQGLGISYKQIRTLSTEQLVELAKNKIK